MKPNKNDCHLLLSGHKYEHRFGRAPMKIFLGVIINNNLNFKQHIENIFKKANRKLSALNRLSRWQSFENRRRLKKAFL